MYLVFNETFAKNVGLKVPQDFNTSKSVE